MFVAAIIPARGGSKSLPKKNIRELAGKPLIQYSIDYALSCDRVDYSFVSSDCPETISLAKHLGARVPFIRPPEYAEDHSRDYSFMRHALDGLETHLNQEIDYLALLRPTSPSRPKGLIDLALAIMEKDAIATSVRTIAETSQHPYRQFIFQSDYLNSPFKGQDDEDEPYNMPRQSLPKFYFQTGDLELVRRSTLLAGSVSGQYIRGLLIDKNDVIDIDDIEDFHRAKIKIEKS